MLLPLDSVLMSLDLSTTKIPQKQESQPPVVSGRDHRLQHVIDSPDFVYSEYHLLAM